MWLTRPDIFISFSHFYKLLQIAVMSLFDSEDLTAGGYAVKEAISSDVID